MPRRSPDPDDFGRAAADLVRRLRGWTRASWAVPAGHGRWHRPPAAGRTRADVVRESLQRLADLAAAAEHRPRRPVPPLADRVLPDALAVMAHDVASAGDPVATQAAVAELAELRAALGAR